MIMCILELYRNVAGSASAEHLLSLGYLFFRFRTGEAL